jgi:hypothetical protein
MLAALFGIVFGVQGGLHTTHAPILSEGDVLALIGLVVIGVITGGLARVLLVRRSRRPAPPPRDEWAARAAMEDLCGSGWQAQITLYGWGAPVPDDAPAARRPMVSLDYTEYRSRGSEDVAVVRRIWAPSIGAALEAMVDARRTDAALEEIERAATAEGDPWDGS